MKYVLISYYERAPKTWAVYGHECEGVNEKLGEFTSDKEAILFAHREYRVPVMRGAGGWIDALLRELAPMEITGKVVINGIEK